MHRQFKLLFQTFFFLVVLFKIVFPQTVVTPVLTLNDAEINDQDDMAIWIHPTDFSLSTIIASDKAAYKLFVYDLDGNTLQTINVSGKPGNIDIRYNFKISGQPTDIVGYNDRDNSTIVFYKVDPSSRELSFISSFDSGSNYGFCLYSSSITEKYYAFSSNQSSLIKQFELSENSGIITGNQVREWSNGSGRTEGMVADEETGKLYCANESEGIYKYDAEPNDPNPTGELIAATDENGLTLDVEGVTIYYAANGEGYLIASSQGSDDFKVYERKEPHSFIKTIEVTGVGNTDGIDVTNLNLGSAFPQGMFLVHDGTGTPYSIKVCNYEDLDLTVDVSSWNPRDYPLPVELAYFAGTLNGNSVELRWRTETEVNNYGFDIERTKDNSA